MQFEPFAQKVIKIHITLHMLKSIKLRSENAIIVLFCLLIILKVSDLKSSRPCLGSILRAIYGYTCRRMWVLGFGAQMSHVTHVNRTVK